MRKIIWFTIIVVWVVGLSILLTRLWLNNPDLLPIPGSISERLVRVYGAQDAEQVADLEILIGMAVTLPAVSLLTFLTIAVFRRR